MTRLLLAFAAALALTSAPGTSASAAEDLCGRVENLCRTVCAVTCDPPTVCDACIGDLSDLRNPCDIVRCTPPCILGVTC